MSKKGTFPWRSLIVSAVLGILGWTIQLMPWQTPNRIGWMIVTAGLTVAAVSLGLYVKWYASTSATLARQRRRAERNGGAVSFREYRRSAGRGSVRRNVRALLPEATAGLGPVARHRIPMREFAYQLAKEARYGPIWSSCEAVVVILGGPRTGKTAAMACYVVDSPGACVVTSTRPDLANVTMAMRRRVGDGTIHVFDPAGTSGIASTIKWAVLAGCRDPRTALRRARDMVPLGATSEHERWNGFARRTLALLMHAAALGGLSMFDVLSWSASPENTAYRRRVEGLIGERSSSENLRVWMDISKQFFEMNQRTQSSITTTLLSSLEWLMDPKACAAGAPVDGSVELFDVATMIQGRQTVYMIGEKTDGVAPLVAALTGEIAFRAKEYAKLRPGGRLDPPLALVLDEAANICPIDLPAWSSFMGGHNVTTFIAAQDPAQLRSVWGHDGTESIINHANTFMVFGGIKEREFLENCCARADILLAPKNADGELTGAPPQRVAVITPGEIASLPAHRAIVFRAGLSYCVVSTPSVYHRRDVRRANDAEGMTLRITETNYAEDLDGGGTDATTGP